MQKTGAICYSPTMETITHSLLLAQSSSMNGPVLAFWDGHPPVNNLIVIFAFVVVLVVIKNIFRMRQSQLWHETARTALEKGQPLPPGAAPASGCGGQHWTCGLIWIAVGVGLYLVNDGDVRNWAVLPICIGVALLLASLIGALFQPSKSGDRQGPNPRL